ncbi:hypothetical protein [Virgibacillus ainsalahensis]
MLRKSRLSTMALEDAKTSIKQTMQAFQDSEYVASSVMGRRDRYLVPGG